MKFFTDVSRKGNNLLVRKIVNGKDVLEKVQFNPSLFISVNERTDYKNFYKSGYIEKISFENMYEFGNYIKRYKDIPGQNIWGMSDPIIQYIYENFDSNYDPNIIRGCFLDIEVMTRQKINNEFVDGGFPIASEAKFPINAICHYDNIDDTFYLFGLSEWEKDKSCFSELASKTIYVKCDTELELMKKWLLLYKKLKPHYITGWNVETFDIPYIVNRMKQLFSESTVNSLSPWDIIETKVLNTKYGEEQIYTIIGVPTLDYLALYKKYTFKNRESYTLDYISSVELHDKKKEFEGTHGSFFWDDPQGFYDYNIKDVSLVKQLDDKLKLLNLAFSIAYFSGINWISTFSPIKTWNSLIFRRCMEMKIAPPIISGRKAREEYEGAYVHEPKPGMVKNIVSCDFTSLYPSIMREWNIGPDTIITDVNILNELNEVAKCNTEFYEAYMNRNLNKYLLKNKSVPKDVENYITNKNCCLATNCTLYSKNNESILYSLLSELFYGRKSDKKVAQTAKKKAKEIENSDPAEYKRLMQEFVIYDTSQLVKKILLNSLYGALGSNFFDLYNAKIAEAITLIGQFLVQESGNHVNETLNKLKKIDGTYIYYGDTDSVVGNTNICINDDVITIEDYYNSVISDEKCIHDKSFVKPVNDATLTVDNDKLVKTKVKYIMKHLVKKRLFKLDIDGNSVILTEDHSLIFERDGKLMVGTVHDIINDDKILYYTE